MWKIGALLRSVVPRLSLNDRQVGSPHGPWKGFRLGPIFYLLCQRNGLPVWHCITSNDQPGDPEAVWSRISSDEYP